jgi:hypothetical protein
MVKISEICWSRFLETSDSSFWSIMVAGTSLGGSLASEGFFFPTSDTRGVMSVSAKAIVVDENESGIKPPL